MEMVAFFCLIASVIYIISTTDAISVGGRDAVHRKISSTFESENDFVTTTEALNVKSKVTESVREGMSAVNSMGKGQQILDDVTTRDNTLFYVGRFEGRCHRNGIYYKNEVSYIVCNHRIYHRQACPIGTKTRDIAELKPNTYYAVSPFCTINLNNLATSASRKRPTDMTRNINTVANGARVFREQDILAPVKYPTKKKNNYKMYTSGVPVRALPVQIVDHIPLVKTVHIEGYPMPSDRQPPTQKHRLKAKKARIQTASADKTSDKKSTHRTNAAKEPEHKEIPGNLPRQQSIEERHYFQSPPFRNEYEYPTEFYRHPDLYKHGYGEMQDNWMLLSRRVKEYGKIPDDLYMQNRNDRNYNYREDNQDVIKNRGPSSREMDKEEFPKSTNYYMNENHQDYRPYSMNENRQNYRQSSTNENYRPALRNENHQDYRPSSMSENHQDYGPSVMNKNHQEYRPSVMNENHQDYRPSSKSENHQHYRTHSINENHQDYRPSLMNENHQDYRPSLMNENHQDYRPSSRNENHQDYRPSVMNKNHQEYRPSVMNTNHQEYRPSSLRENHVEYGASLPREKNVLQEHIKTGQLPKSDEIKKISNPRKHFKSSKIGKESHLDEDNEMSNKQRKESPESRIDHFSNSFVKDGSSQSEFRAPPDYWVSPQEYAKWSVPQDYYSQDLISPEAMKERYPIDSYQLGEANNYNLDFTNMYPRGYLSENRYEQSAETRPNFGDNLWKDTTNYESAYRSSDKNYFYQKPSLNTFDKTVPSNEKSSKYFPMRPYTKDPFRENMVIDSPEPFQTSNSNGHNKFIEDKDSRKKYIIEGQDNQIPTATPASVSYVIPSMKRGAKNAAVSTKNEQNRKTKPQRVESNLNPIKSVPDPYTKHYFKNDPNYDGHIYPQKDVNWKDWLTDLTEMEYPREANRNHNRNMNINYGPGYHQNMGPIQAPANRHIEISYPEENDANVNEAAVRQKQRENIKGTRRQFQSPVGKDLSSNNNKYTLPNSHKASISSDNIYRQELNKENTNKESENRQVIKGGKTLRNGNLRKTATPSNNDFKINDFDIRKYYKKEANADLDKEAEDAFVGLWMDEGGGKRHVFQNGREILEGKSKGMNMKQKRANVVTTPWM